MRVIVKMRSGQEIKFSTDKNSVTVGRSNKSDMVIPDESLSRQHALFEFENGQFFVTDLGSVNGVFINGEKIPPSERTPFSAFFQISLGALECQVEDNTGQELTKVNRPYDLPDESSLYSGLTQHLDMKELKRATPKKIEKKTITKTNVKNTSPAKNNPKTNANFIKTIVIVVVFVLVGILTRENQDSTPKVETLVETPPSEAPYKKSIEQKEKMSPDSFLTKDEYIKLMNSKSCEGEDSIRLCRDFELSASQGEGLIKLENDFYLFMNLSAHIEKPVFANIKDKENIELFVSMYYALKSNSMYNIIDSKEGQIHFVLFSTQGPKKKVFRFHPKYLSDQDTRIKILTELSDVLRNGKTNEIILKYGSLFPPNEFE